MQLNFKRLVILLGISMLVVVGCKNQLPTMESVGTLGGYSANPPDRQTICNFDNGQVSVNPYIFEPTNGPTYYLYSAGSWTLPQNAPYVIGLMQVVSPGYESSNCLHLSGTVDDPGTGLYPQFSLRCSIEATKYYDCSFFTGVEFALKIMPDDNAPQRLFEVPIAATDEAADDPRGTCTSNCYNHFRYALPTGPGSGQWQYFQIPFSLLTEPSFGNNAPWTPNKIIRIEWDEDRNNAAGTSTIDYYLDQVSFY